MSTTTFAPTDLSTNTTVAVVCDELEAIADEFNRKTARLTKAEFLTALDGSAQFYGVDATLMVMQMIDDMFEDAVYGSSYFTYGLTSRIDVAIVRLSK